MAGAISFAQDISKSPTIVNNPEMQAAKDSLKHVKIYNDSIDYEISLVNSHLNSIDYKWNWIENNPQEHQIASDSGWFTKMTTVKTELNAKKEELTLLKK
ncbi:MAG: hypothetical protein ACI857_001609 [Arenicella sp.]|jgi:hypothetical protein